MENHEHIVYIKLAEGDEEKERESGGGEKENNESIIRKEFKQFDIILKADANNFCINDDHFYASSSLSLSKIHQQIKLYSSETRKRIMEEWRILEESLPDSIYVRAYKGRIDLLRAVIIGSEGTPYHDGLFFFDIQFPPSYPNVPPNVYYHAFHFQLNPNLFRTGDGCLSLLESTASLKNGVWNPSDSTILQLLLTIQGLVLNTNSNFNHPINRSLFPKLFFGVVVSSNYNEDVLLFSCMTMLAVLKSPPRHFEEFVAQHFRDRAESILISCKAHIDVRVKSGDHPNTGSSSFSSMAAKHVSKKFQDSMGTTYSKLVQAFIENGSSLDSYRNDHLVELSDHVDERLSYLLTVVLVLFCFFTISWYVLLFIGYFD